MHNMKEYYVRFNEGTKKVDVLCKSEDSLIGSTQVNYGIVNSTDLEQIAESLHIVGKFHRDFDLLEVAIFNEWNAHQE